MQTTLSSLITRIEALDDLEAEQHAELAGTRSRAAALRRALAARLREVGAVTTGEHVYRIQGGAVVREPVRAAVYVDVADPDGLDGEAALEPTGADDFVVRTLDGDGREVAPRYRPVPPEPEVDDMPARVAHAAHAVVVGEVS